MLAITRGELVPELGDQLIRRLDARRAQLLGALAAGGPVYGVTTGMGALSQRRLSETEQYQEAAQSCRIALDGAIEVLACEFLAVHQARCLGATLPDDAAQLGAALDTLTAGLTTSTADRPFGRDIETLRERLANRAGRPRGR